MTATRRVALILVITIPYFANAQNAEQTITNAEPETLAESATASIPEPASETSTRPIEEIEVIGGRTLTSMRYRVRVAESTLYNLFNDLNSADKFDILCKTERRTHTYIPQYSCEPKFFLSYRQEVNRNALTEIRGAFTSQGYDPALFQLGIDKLEHDSEVRARLVGDYESLEQEMFRIATENPEYLEQLIKVGELREQYQAARDTRFGKKDDD
jgi:hypothetical protein